MTPLHGSPRAIRFAVGAAALGIIASATTLAAPPASATVTGIGIAPSFTLGTHRYGTTCTYTVRVTVDDNTKPVYFFEEGQGPTGFAQAMPSGGEAQASWIPSRPDIGYIYAVQPDAWPETRQVVDVGTGINFGSACVAL
ncbi:hypothetical protein ACH474_02130 [Nocardia rhamnosiphila]|uniref:hypothetical protein n=1 Tax=Nocardia rhamnosiphila TaxID=426716 RepID=UPI000691578E|nr:hypothetical protein [Nocardia rhamnosiphila]